ncbi:MAG: rhodanese-like domain-containing protein [Alphaproteobacteria bacterium]|nr:rhodanese-like domain-containing protein [Alphaproteobacteria bacterium]
MLFAVSLVLGCASSAPAPETPVTTTTKVETAAKGTRVDTDITGLEKALSDGALVVDVRTDGEWANGHVPGAKHLPLSDLSADHPILAEHDKAQPVYFVCESGGRSGRAADAMSAVGFKAVNVKGGTSAWREAGKPLDPP